MSADAAASAFAREVSRPDPEIDLTRAALVIAQGEYPDLEIDGYLDRFEALARRARGEQSGTDPRAQLDRLRTCLFEEEGFAGNTEDYSDPRNSYLSDVLDRRLGIPITLSLVLIDVGRRVGLEMDGIGLPGHFVTGARVGEEQVLLDPFNGGAILSGEECHDVVARALGGRVELTDEHFRPVSHRQFLTRLLTNLKASYWRRESWDKVVTIIDRLMTLHPRDGNEWRDRGFAWTKLGEPTRAIADWERYLTEYPSAPDRERVRAALRRARHGLARLN